MRRSILRLLLIPAFALGPILASSCGGEKKEVGAEDALLAVEESPPNPNPILQPDTETLGGAPGNTISTLPNPAAKPTTSSTIAPVVAADPGEIDVPIVITIPQPVILEPAQNPLSSAEATALLKGQCVADLLIRLSRNEESQTQSCSPVGTFQFQLNATLPGVYLYTLIQEDALQNTSEALSFTWDYNPGPPNSPVLTQPSSSSVTGNSKILAIKGLCLPGHIVHLSGDVELGEISINANQLPCQEQDQFEFFVEKASDGDFVLQLHQSNPVTTLSSQMIQVNWQLDATAPNPVVLQNPATGEAMSPGPLSISGTCETSATVYLKRDSETSSLCNDGTFSFAIDKLDDGLYRFELSQVDSAGNSSELVEIQWTKDTSIPAALLITQPASSPSVSNSDSLTIAGSCSPNAIVHLGGDVAAEEIQQPLGQLSQDCVAGAFAFNLRKEIVALEDQFVLSLHQTDYKGFSSQASEVIWIRDLELPDLTLVNSPQSPNLLADAGFTFSSTEVNVVFECKLDAGSWVLCPSPQVYSGLTNGPHNLEVRAKDLAGNLSEVISFDWNQGFYQTLALFHFDTANSLLDSSLYAAHNLTNQGGVAAPAGQFSEGITFANTNDNAYFAPNQAIKASRKQLTFEFWFRANSLGSNESQTIIEQASSAQDYSFGLQMQRTGNSSSARFHFTASLDGSTQTTVSSSAFAFSTLNWSHLALVWNQGQVTFYLNGSLLGTGSIGTVGSAELYSSSANIFIGNRYQLDRPLQSYLDELRISNGVRYAAPFIAPNGPFVAD